MEKIAGPGGSFAIFRFIQYMPYIAIGLLIIMIVFWVIFGVKKLKWAKTMAVISTVFVAITSLLFFSPYLIGAMTGKQIPMRGIFGTKEFPADDKEQFRDFRDRQDDKRKDKQGYEQEKEKSGLDIETKFQFIEADREIIAL